MSASDLFSRRAFLTTAGHGVAVIATISLTPAAFAQKGPIEMTERTVKFDDIEIATQAFGDPSHQPILLIMGAMASMLWWPEEFCERLAAMDRYVIRYDNRDTGLSTFYPPGPPPYSKDDLAEDAIRVLDAYGLASAHVVGMSLGGEIAQIAALAHPDKIRTLTLISTSPVGIDTSSLPQTSDTYMQHAAQGEDVDWSDTRQAIDFIVKDTRMIAGTAHPYDEARARNLVQRDARRAKNFASATNHFMLQGGDAWKGQLEQLAVPTLVIHGTADPIFPIEHGALLAKTIPAADLVRLEGGGHELHPQDWDTILSHIETQTAG